MKEVVTFGPEAEPGRIFDDLMSACHTLTQNLGLESARTHIMVSRHRDTDLKGS